MLAAKWKQAFWGEHRQTLNKEQTKQLMFRYVFSTVIGFLLTRLTMLGFLSGFGFSFAAALPLPFSFSGLIGCVLGEFFEGFNIQTLITIGMLAIWIATKKWISCTTLPKHYMGVFWQSTAIGVILVIQAVVYYFLLDASLMQLMQLLLGVVVQLSVFISTMIFGSAFFSNKSLSEYSNAQALAAVVLGVILIASLGTYQFNGFYLAGIVSVMIVTIAAFRFGCVGGALSGILCGMGMVIYDTEMLEFSGIMMVGAFLSGLFARRSKLTASVSMIVIHYALVLIYGKPLQMLPLTLCTMIGVILFLCIPIDALERLELPSSLYAHGPPQYEYQMAQQYEKKLKIRMDFAADAVDMLSESVGELADILQKDIRPDNEQLYATVEQTLCRRCRRRFHCYGTEYDNIRASFNDLSGSLRGRTQVDTEQFPEFLKENCIRPNDLIRVFTSSYQQLRFQSNQQRQVNRARSLVMEQYTAMVQLMKDLGEDRNQMPDVQAEEILLEHLSREGYAPHQVCCTRNENEYLFIDLYYDHKKPPLHELKELIEKYLQVHLDDPVEADAKNMIKISFYQPPPYGVELAITQVAAKKQANGDTVISFYDGSGNFYLLLSDGMGRGKKAALDSMTVCTILSKLITAGFSWKAALKLLNTALVVKSAEESLATVDIVRVNLYTSEAEFIKAGAASSFWASDRNVSRIRSFTLPIGIVSGISFDSKKVSASAGDILLLLSDGIGDDENWIAGKILKCRQQNLKKLTDVLCAEADDVDGEVDDKTAAALRLVLYRTSEKEQK